MMKRTVFLAAPWVLILLSGCSMVPNFQRPAVDTPTQWHAQQGVGVGVGADTQAQAVTPDWWTRFGSAELNTLMATALQNNNDMRAALHRIEQSRAGVRIAGANLLPTASATGGATRAFTDPATGPRTSGTSLQAGVGISYELDLFGAQSATIAAARSNLAGTQYNRDALALVVMGDVAQTYFNILNHRDRLRIADENLANAREILRIVDARFNAGSASALELSQQRAAVASAEAGRATIAQSMTVSENALAVLLGQAPQSLTVTARNLAALTVPAIAPAQPSALLERRPDIKAAEATLHAANANIGVARAAFFPRISLGVNSSIAATGLGDPATTALSLASSLAAPLFQGGRLVGGVEQATARQAELAELYRKTVLTSFQEVEDALAAVNTAQTRENALAVAQREARTAYDLSRARYDAGTIDFQTLLDTQTALLQADDNFAQAKNERLSAAITLFKALGGSWSES